jgi:hypothetical protein
LADQEGIGSPLERSRRAVGDQIADELEMRLGGIVGIGGHGSIS